MTDCIKEARKRFFQIQKLLERGGLLTEDVLALHEEQTDILLKIGDYVVCNNILLIHQRPLEELKNQ